MTFFSENDKFQDGLDEAGCRDPSRMKEGLFSHRLSPRRSSPTVTIKRYKLFSDRHCRKISRGGSAEGTFEIGTLRFQKPFGPD